ncbi:MHC class II regulatory factor RFX1 isoform X1 [Engraulis encrasicolus]|uniref:MHC class II regulatory factor RFX1 isoform X1 n=1 Tax=Engraulis encrasicolus TaxID=184585 RepID=UPI002FD079C3
MATPAFVGELQQQSSQPQGGGSSVNNNNNASTTTASPATSHFLSDVVQVSPASKTPNNSTNANNSTTQGSSSSSSSSSAGGLRSLSAQATAAAAAAAAAAASSSASSSSNSTQKPSSSTSSSAALVTSNSSGAAGQPQYVTAEIQTAGAQSSNGQSTPQYIVVTVTEGSLHSNDSVSDSSPPPSVVQTGVPTQVVQQVQTAQASIQQQQQQQRGELETETDRGIQRYSGGDSGTGGGAGGGGGGADRWRHAEQNQEEKEKEKEEEKKEEDQGMAGKKAGHVAAAAAHLHASYEPWLYATAAGAGDWVYHHHDPTTVTGTGTGTTPHFPHFLPVSHPSSSYPSSMTSYPHLPHPHLPHPLSVQLQVPVHMLAVDGETLAPVLLCESMADVTTALRVQQQPIQQGSVPHVYSSQEQYVEGRDANFTGAIRSGSYPYSETSLYSQATATGSYYESSPSAASQIVANSSSGAGAGVTVGMAGSTGTSSGSAGGASAAAAAVVEGGGGGGEGAGSYVLPGGYMLGGAGSNSSSQGYTHTTRASPATVEWLLDNYETAEGVSLPRCTLYCHYLLHCQEAKLEPVNAASFGKLIRSVFMGLRTRRLGTRGNSKYHYYGLRIKAGSALLRLMEDQQHLAMRQQPFTHKQRLKPVQKVEGITNGMSLGAVPQQGGSLSDISAQVQQYQQFLDATRSLPEFPVIELESKVAAAGLTIDNIAAYQQLYREHCEAILDVMVNLQFPLVETLWKTFWRFDQNQSNDATDPATMHDESEKRLPKSALVLLCKYEPVLNWSRECDNILYQNLVEVLIPDVLRPIPSALTQAIRNFGKSVETWLSNAMMNIPEEMVRVKVTCVGAFAQTLRRYTSLNHLAQAARAVLQNTTQINQMLSDLNRVDFANVQEQASWVCRCEERVVQRLEQDFKVTLQQQNSLEQWAAWLDGVVSQVLKPYQQSPAFPKAAKQFLLKWSFYSSMVIRDLTLRSAASFGSFHLIRLLYDEYMYYLIEHRVAQAKGETPIAVMGEFSTLSRSLNTLDPDKDEEEEEDDESDEECPELPAHAAAAAAGADSSLALEPSAKRPRTDSGIL